MTYEPPFIPEIETPADFVTAVKNSLQYWLDIHTDAEAWAAEWITDGNADFFYKEGTTKGVIENPYFTFDLWKVCRELQAEAQVQYFHKCGHCGDIRDDGWGTCDNESECEDVEWDEVTVPELAEWLNELDDESPPAEWIVYKAMETEGFTTYREALEPVTCNIETEVKEVLESIENAEDSAALLQACMWGTRVYHVHGNILDDYGERLGIAYQTIVSIRDNGLESVFDSDTIREWLSE